MNQPVTELDQRFSDPDAVAAGWDDSRRVLEAAELSWICMVRPDGRPHLTRWRRCGQTTRSTSALVRANRNTPTCGPTRT